jgi:hypothetical protein
MIAATCIEVVEGHVDEDQQAGSRRGNIGNEIFEQVEEIMKEEGLSRTNAFQRLSEKTGRRAGTVAANYYRVARQRGAELQPRAPRGSKRRAGGRTASSGDAEAALGRAMESLQELAGVVRTQEKELATLRSQAEQFDKLRSILGKI